MAFERESLKTLLDRVYSNYMRLLKPLGKTPRHNIMKVLAYTEGGDIHQLLGDLSFLSEQIFPDTASGEYLRAHWSDRVPPLYATAATGMVIQTGLPGTSVPKGLIYASESGKRYYTTRSYTIPSSGSVEVYVVAEESGTSSNLGAGSKLSVVSALSAGLDSKAKVSDDGILGGVDSESDEDYRSRTISYARNPGRYGKTGDFAVWAVDSSSEVSKAFEIPNFGVFGSLLIQCIHGNQIDGVSRVHNLDIVRSYIEKNSPPIIFTVATPELVSVSPAVRLPEREDTLENRNIAIQRLKVFLNVRAAPGCRLTESALRAAIVDGMTITDAEVMLPGGEIATTVLQYPVFGEVRWS